MLFLSIYHIFYSTFNYLVILCFLQYQVQQQDQICEQPTGAGTDHSTGVCQHSSQHHQVNQADINDINNISMSVCFSSVKAHVKRVTSNQHGRLLTCLVSRCGRTYLSLQVFSFEVQSTADILVLKCNCFSDHASSCYCFNLSVHTVFKKSVCMLRLAVCILLLSRILVNISLVSFILVCWPTVKV